MSRGMKQGLVLALVMVLCGVSAVQAAPGKLATPHAAPTGIEWRPVSSELGLVLTVSGPRGFYLRQEVAAGQAAQFSLFDAAGALRPAGSYVYELRAVPRIDQAARVQLEAARERGDQAAPQVKIGRLANEIQSGAFAIADGTIVMGAEEEPGAGKPGGSRLAPKDQVIPDDLIVQGSICTGFDCVNNENFGFDTIRLKENNLRIKFEDTSVGTFPTNDWQLTANDSASGGQSKFSIEDITGARVPFTVEAGSTTNSIYVDSTGRVGFRTSTPVLDLHVNTSNTPALRLEQNNSGGFTAQTWDIAGNEANFFVRDVTGGSLLSFRIRPGAPTSSIDIANDGDVGIGTASPQARLHVAANSTGAAARYVNSNGTGFAGAEYFEGATQGLFVGLDNGANTSRINTVNNYALSILTNGAERITFPAAGTDFITSSSGAHLTNTGTWADASSRDYKQDIENLDLERAMEALEALVPVSYRYKANPAEQQVGFIAEDVPDLVAMPDRKSLAALEIVAVLTRVVQDQEQRIEALKLELAELRAQQQ